MNNEPKWILIAEDDEDDFCLFQEAFRTVKPDIQLHRIADGEEMIDFLEKLRHPSTSLPLLIVLDLNMPKVDGWEVLRQIKASPKLQHIPVVVLTNSNSREEAAAMYRAGANSFIRKPAGFGELKQFVDVFCRYWFQHASLI